MIIIVESLPTDAKGGSEAQSFILIRSRRVFQSRVLQTVLPLQFMTVEKVIQPEEVFRQFTSLCSVQFVFPPAFFQLILV